MLVGSEALALAEPPPDTVAWLVKLVGALAATWTLTETGG
jgi:hypothetical protein